MINLNEIMKNLQQASESLSKMNANLSNPWQSINQIQEVFNHDFWNQFSHLTTHANDSNPKENEPKEISKVTPSIDVFQTLSKVIVCCEIPGLDRNSIKISVSNGNQLKVQGKIKEHDLSEYLVKRERLSGEFMRKIQLPCDVIWDGNKMAYKDGLLEIRLSRINVG